MNLNETNQDFLSRSAHRNVGVLIDDRVKTNAFPCNIASSKHAGSWENTSRVLLTTRGMGVVRTRCISSRAAVHVVPKSQHDLQQETQLLAPTELFRRFSDGCKQPEVARQFSLEYPFMNAVCFTLSLKFKKHILPTFYFGFHVPHALGESLFAKQSLETLLVVYNSVKQHKMVKFSLIRGHKRTNSERSVVAVIQTLAAQHPSK